MSIQTRQCNLFNLGLIQKARFDHLGETDRSRTQYLELTQGSSVHQGRTSGQGNVPF